MILKSEELSHRLQTVLTVLTFEGMEENGESKMEESIVLAQSYLPISYNTALPNEQQY